MSSLEIPDHLTFQDKGEPATEDQIAAAEKKLGRKIPAPYRELLTEHNGCRVDPPNFKIPGAGGEGPSGEYGSVSWFLGVDVQESLDIAAIAEMYEGRIPKGKLAIARDPGGNLILMDAKGKLYFWDHEFEDEDEEDDSGEPSGDNVHKLADDFESFLAGLEE